AECMRRFWMREPVNKAMMDIWVSDNWKDNSTWFQNIFNSTDPMTRDGETVLSWEPFEKVDPSNNGAEVPVGAYLLTPFGAITQQTNAPQKWYEGRTDCPWRINLPTATAPTIGLMLMGALPKEFHEQVASVPSGHPPLTRTDGTWVLGDWTNYESGSIYNAIAGSTYPGCSVSPGDWSNNFGESINVNHKSRWWYSYNNNDPWESLAPMSPLHGQWGALYTPLWWTIDDPGKTGWLRYGHHFNKEGASDNKMGGYQNEHSFYMDIAQAFVNAVAYVQARWADKLREFKDANADGVHDERDIRPYEGIVIDSDPNFPDTVKEVDKIFLANLGIDMMNPSSTTPYSQVPCARRQGNYALVLPNIDTWKYGNAETFEWPGAASNNIASLKSSIGDAKANLMEKVLNDFRMSVFGASPQYNDFQFLDFSGDGTAHASDGGTAPNRSPLQYWSFSGYFVFQKGRYYRVFARGEVFDLYRRLPVAQADYEAVIAIDREGRVWDVNNIKTGSDDPKVEILYQRWHDNRYKMNLPRTYP
ncbi:MAG: hypothetical protein N3B15_07110, partial [Planctomycetota bacterium]|nr:hypothetical protein [Planctomycetota bacterium]